MMTKTIKASAFAFLAFLILLLLSIYFSSFEVMEGEMGASALNAKVVYAPGLHFKWPWQKVVILDLTPNVTTVVLPVTINGVVYKVSWALVSDGNPHPNVPNVKQIRSLSALQALQDNHTFITALSLSDAEQETIYRTMQNKAASIAAGIVKEGAKQAEAIRIAAEQNFLKAEEQALNFASDLMAVGNREAIELLMPVYQKNPALFKAYIQAKTALFNHARS